jgi:MarR-like DNA-binding transcriptional regulator SgrR of sgrS sRNA
MSGIRTSRRTWLALAGGAGAVAALPGWMRTARAAAARRFGGTLVAALLEKAPLPIAGGGGNPHTLDPHFARTRLERELAAALHVPLFARAPPHLASRNAGLLVETAAALGRDARSWAVTLRPGLVFADGSPIVAADAAASLTRALVSPTGRALAGVLAAARATSERRLELEWKMTVRDPAAFLSGLAASIVITRGAPADRVFGPIGAGAMRAPLPGDGASATEAGELMLVANSRAPGGRAFLDRLRLVTPRDAADAAALFRRGAAQVVPAPPGATDPRAKDERVDADAASTIALVLSSRLPAEVRARVAAAPNRNVIADVFLQGRARVAGSLLPPALLGASASPASPAPVTPPHEKPPKAASKTALSLFVADTSPEIRAVAERLVWDLLAVGVAATIGWKTPEALDDAVARDRWDLVLTEWVPADADPGRALAGASRDPALASTLAPAGSAPGAVAPVELDALALVEDLDARTAAALVLADRLRAAGLIVPIVHPRRTLRRAPSVEGLVLDAWGNVDWSDVSLSLAGGAGP